MKIKKIAANLTALMMMVTGLTLTSAAEATQNDDPGYQTGGLVDITHITCGDVNGDGAVTARDLVYLKSYLCGEAELEKLDAKYISADISKDSEVNIIDYVLLKKILLDAGVPESVIENAVASPDMSRFTRSYEKADTADYNKFTANSASVLFTDENNKNINPVYSPISVYMALSMLAECTDGTTLNELTDTLCADDIEDLRKSNNDIFNNLYLDVNTQNNIAYCKIANSFWLNDLYNYDDDTLKLLADSYYTSSFLKNFADPQTPDQISKWINNNTSGKFSPPIVINSPKEDVLKIINTITFKDDWVNKFNTASTYTFHTIDNGDKECEFLGAAFRNYDVEFGDGFIKTAIEMKHHYKMNFILPDENTTVEQIVSSPEKMLDIFNQNTESKKAAVLFSAPKFNVSSKFDLIDWAKKLGIKSAFSNSADFSKISDMNLKVSEITHEATIQINENGCEAAAYTSIAMAGGSFPDEVVEFYLDRPFFYYVSDDNGTPVFSGIINDPTAN